MLDALSKSFFTRWPEPSSLESMPRASLARPTSFARRLSPGETGRGKPSRPPRPFSRRACCFTSISWATRSRTLAEPRPPRRSTSRSSRDPGRRHRPQHLGEATQLGLDIDQAVCVDNIKRILDLAKAARLSSCASTWRTRPTSRRRSTCSRRSGRRDTATRRGAASRRSSAARRTRGRCGRSARACAS